MNYIKIYTKYKNKYSYKYYIIMLLLKINSMNWVNKKFLRMHLKNIKMLIIILIYFILIQLLFITLLIYNLKWCENVVINHGYKKITKLSIISTKNGFITEN